MTLLAIKERLCTFAAGNAYPVGLMLAAVTMVRAIADSEVDLETVGKEPGNHEEVSHGVIDLLSRSGPRKKSTSMPSRKRKSTSGPSRTKKVRGRR